MSLPYFSLQEWLILHILFSSVLSLTLTSLLRSKYKISFVILFSVVFVINLITPILGYLFTLILTIILVKVGNKQYLHSVQSFNQKEFLQNTFPQVQRIFGEGAIASLATDTKNHSPNKMKGLVFMSNHPTKQNFQLIKGLLSDPNNEIRLYSFSVLAQAEGELNEKISYALQKREKTKDVLQRADFNADLAHYHWEFIHYGLSDKETRKLIQNKVVTYANLALTQQPKNAKLYLLLGKNAFLQKAYHEASKYFKKALLYGIPKNTLAPYLAEIAYHHKQFQEVKKLLLDINPLATSALTSPIHAQWIKA